MLRLPLLVRIASRLVPGHQRTEWREEWGAEYAALQSAREEGVDGLPGAASFALAAVVQAWWLFREGWRVDGIVQDVRYGLRTILTDWRLTSISAVTLALGIGANGVLFSLVNGLMFRPPAAVQAPDGLVQLGRSYDAAPRWDNFSWPAYRALGEQVEALEGVAGFASRSFVIGDGSASEPVMGQYVTGSFFQLLGIAPAAGRVILPSDAASPGAGRVVVISHRQWLRRFGGDAGAVGSALTVGSESYEIIGVAPAGFTGVESLGSEPGVWIPVSQYPPRDGVDLWTSWGLSWLTVLGRLDSGQTETELEASLESASRYLRQASSENLDIRVIYAGGVGLDPEERAEAAILTGVIALIAALVLLLACANAASIAMVRAASRQSELNVRLALGAARSRLFRQMMVESVLIAGMAGLLATPIIGLSDRVLSALFPFTVAVSLTPDTRVYLVLALMTLAAASVFGFAPAWTASRQEISFGMRLGRQGGRFGRRMRDGLVVSQLSLSLALLIGALLLGRSVINAREADPGFNADDVRTVFLPLGASGRYGDAETTHAALAAMLGQARETPGIAAAAVSTVAPIAGGHPRASVAPEGREGDRVEADVVSIGEDYFHALGLGIVRGRALLAPEVERSDVVVISESTADLFWPGEDPIGRRLSGDPGWEVVGMAADAKMRSLRVNPRPTVFFPISGEELGTVALHLRGPTGPPSEALARGVAAGMDPQLPMSTIHLRDAAEASLGETQVFGLLVGAFAGLAIALAVVGLYGLVSFDASQRVREIGIRRALGAPAASVVGLVMRRVIVITSIGLMLGSVLGVAVSNALRGMLFGVGTSDPRTLVVAATTLAATAILAALQPALNASRAGVVSSLNA